MLIKTTGQRRQRYQRPRESSAQQTVSSAYRNLCCLMTIMAISIMNWHRLYCTDFLSRTRNLMLMLSPPRRGIHMIAQGRAQRRPGYG